MGKNIDTKQLLQIGKKNNKYIWNSKYFETYTNESQIYLFQSVEIKNFIDKFLNNYGLNLYKYNITFLDSKLKIFISYFKTFKIKNFVSKTIKLVKKKKIKKKYLYKKFLYTKIKRKTLKKKKNLKIHIFNKFYNFYKIYIKQFFLLKKKMQKIFQCLYIYTKFKTFIEKRFFLIKLNYFISKIYKLYFQQSQKINTNLIFKNKLKNFYNLVFDKQTILKYINNIKLKKLLLIKYQNYLKHFLLIYWNYKKLFKILLLNKKLYKKRIKILRYYKNYKNMNKTKTIKSFKMNNFIKKCNESFKLFTKNKFSTNIIFQQINKNVVFNLTYGQLQLLKKLTTQLRQFKNIKFFKEGVNTILSSLINCNNTELLVKFIAYQLQLSKRHGIFLKFLTKTISLLLKHKFSKVKSVKIFIKGRINGKPRSSHKVIFINKYMSLMSIDSSILFNQSIANNLTGSFGVKLWFNTY